MICVRAGTRGSAGVADGVVEYGEPARGEAEKGRDGGGVHRCARHGGYAECGAGKVEVLAGDAGIDVDHGKDLVVSGQVGHVGNEEHGAGGIVDEVLTEFGGAGQQGAPVALLDKAERMACGNVFKHAVGAEDVGADFLPVERRGVGAVGGSSVGTGRGVGAVDADGAPEQLAEDCVFYLARRVEVAVAAAVGDGLIERCAARECGGGEFYVFGFHSY